MGKSNFNALLTIIVFLAFSCTKDNCQDAICLNGGICNNGTCQCEEGYSGEHCDSYDLCFKVVCENGGHCELGDCICPPGWTGTNCQTPVPPTIVRITKIEVVKFPGSRPMMGTPWDPDPPPNDKPDIFPVIQQDTLMPPLWLSPFVVFNAFPANPYVFTDNLPFDLVQPTLPHAIRLMDSDAPSVPESMGKLSFDPYLPGNGFPQQIVLDPGGPLAFRLTLNYIW